MIKKTKAEERLIGVISDERDKVVLERACDIVQKIWSSEVRIVKDYTDHGYEHSQRIIEKIYEMYKVHPEALTQKELFFLLLGVYLHDIGMQCDIKKHADIKKLAEEKYGAEFRENYSLGTANSYTMEEQNEIRKNHHLLTGAWLEYSFKNKTIFSPLVEMLDSMYLQDLIDICRFHSKLSITDCVEESDWAGIKTRFVAAILRFGDELDIDKERVHIETVNEFGYKTDNAIFWHLHDKTRIIIKESSIKLSVYLSDKDYEKVGSCINDIYIQRFKAKNKILTDIMTQNGFSFFISEDSGVEKNSFVKELPEEIVSGLQQMHAKESRSEEDSSWGKEEKIEFMQKYKSEFLNEASKIKLLIDNLKAACNISCAEVDEIACKMEELYAEKSLKAIQDKESVLEKVYRIYLFVMIFSVEQLTYLSNLGLGIRVQVYTGQAQPYVRDFFERYHRNKDKPEVLERYIQADVFFDSYTFEQIGRVLRSYQEIISFNTDDIIFSDSSRCSGFTAQRLLAVSVSGESNKIFVWDTESKRREYVATLGGLFEAVFKVKIYRYKGEIIIAACGRRQIYFWNLSSGVGEPAYISKAIDSITDYMVFESINGQLYVMGLVGDRIYLWKMFEGEKPIRNLAGGDDIFVLNTRLTDAKDDYGCMGRRAFCDFDETKIVQLTENGELNFERTAIYEVFDVLDVKERSEDGFGNRINAYALDKKGQRLFLVINTDVYVYDLKGEGLKRVIKHEGQRILNIRVNSWKQSQGLLTYSIYQQYRKEDMELLHYYQLRENEIVEHKKWTVEPLDISEATFSMSGTGEDIFFSHLFKKTIYRIDSDTGRIVKFYTLPDTFSIEHMILE